MIENITWIEGEPTECGWYLVAIRTNDVSEYYYIKQVWFNPMSIDKYYLEGGSASDSKMIPLQKHQVCSISAHADVPKYRSGMI